MAKQRKEMHETDPIVDFGDIGNFDVPDIDTSLVSFIPADEAEETRYTNPKAVQQETEQVMFTTHGKWRRE